MVNGNKKHAGAEEPLQDEIKRIDAPANLPQSFYLELLQLPLCKLSGGCDGCGRCEH